uniref:Uncharacterized protein n=1 Tax=Arundo donax TaxID=35708 RepID=A0A0A8ZX33_ARUDO
MNSTNIEYQGSQFTTFKRGQRLDYPPASGRIGTRFSLRYAWPMLCPIDYI